MAKIKQLEIKPPKLYRNWNQNTISWDEKLDLDVWYVDNKSIWLDIKILILTIKKVILRQDISGKDSVTMPPFKGSDKN